MIEQIITYSHHPLKANFERSLAWSMAVCQQDAETSDPERTALSQTPKWFFHTYSSRSWAYRLSVLARGAVVKAVPWCRGYSDWFYVMRRPRENPATSQPVE